MTRRLVEGAFSDPVAIDVPYYCPRCGRRLEEYSWVTVEGDKVYPSRVCYAGAPRWWIGLKRLFAWTRVDPHGAHYQFELLPERTVVKTHFDRRDGRFVLGDASDEDWDPREPGL